MGLVQPSASVFAHAEVTTSSLRSVSLGIEQSKHGETKFVGTPKKVTTHVNQNEDLIFEKSSPGKKGYRLAELDVPAVDAADTAGVLCGRTWELCRS